MMLSEIIRTAEAYMNEGKPGLSQAWSEIAIAKALSGIAFQLSVMNNMTMPASMKSLNTVDDWVAWAKAQGLPVAEGKNEGDQD